MTTDSLPEGGMRNHSSNFLNWSKSRISFIAETVRMTVRTLILTLRFVFFNTFSICNYLIFSCTFLDVHCRSVWNALHVLTIVTLCFFVCYLKLS